MLRILKKILAVSIFVCAVQQASAFSMLGPFNAFWQIQRLGYQNVDGQIGGPMNLGEEYRWNVPVLYYGIDRTFLDYFGDRGVVEIDKAVKILNDLPPASSMNIDDFPLKSERINFRAQALGLFDLKSIALAAMIEEMGLAAPSRFVFTLRVRWTTAAPSTNYFVIKRNFDPVTYQPTSYINGDLWTYTTIADGAAISLVINGRVDPLAYGNPVADVGAGLTGFSVGSFFTGLTRDDVGALKYIYRPNNYNVENAITNAFAGGGGGVVAPGGIGVPSSPWSTPVFTTNVVVGGGGITNVAGGNTNFINTGLRSGVNKVRFVKVQYDSILGQSIAPFVDTFSDAVVVNNRTVTQTLQRIVAVTPDFLFAAADLVGGPEVLRPFALYARTVADGWANNKTLNGQTLNPNADSGPGVIEPPVAITFSKTGPVFENGPWPFFLSEDNQFFIYPVWGSFDGTTNAPVVYPNNVTIQDLERRVLGR